MSSNVGNDHLEIRLVRLKIEMDNWLRYTAEAIVWRKIPLLLCIVYMLFMLTVHDSALALVRVPFGGIFEVIGRSGYAPT